MYWIHSEVMNKAKKKVLGTDYICRVCIHATTYSVLKDFAELYNNLFYHVMTPRAWIRIMNEEIWKSTPLP